ncbi:hypothetical protein LAZ67_4002282 [Cordylochernes scorpioides]|uniref:Uncharacterized protein n=1 Tax=Cordylochernes scorpioides TaxID=51811 RepID=A0ABY6KCV4_9ARAC|nr:hypothetical protein LAZ67_4002282 [Cordylochernes scorpioides]
MTALSTTEPELFSLCDGICDGKWCTSLLEELGQNQLIDQPIEVNTDFQSLKNWIKNPMHSNRIRHINRKYHYIKDDFNDNIIALKYISSEDNPADIMTKNLSGTVLNNHLQNIGIKNSSEVDNILRVLFAFSISIVKRLASEFKRGLCRSNMTHVKDAKRANTPEAIEKVYNIVLDNRRLSQWEYRKGVEHFARIIRMRNLCSRWVCII